MDALTISVVLLWIAVLALGLLLWALSRQVGVLFERVAPMGALITDAGPAVGQPSPIFDITGLQSEQVVIGGPQAHSTLLFFLAPTCPVCKKLIPILKQLSSDEAGQLRVVLASDGEADHLKFMRDQGLQSMPYLLSTELGMSYRVSRLPYAVLIDREGLVRSKGLVNSREQLDSLLNAQDMGTHSIQQYLEQQTARAHS
jgi:methylamine dehydrogenase accessory protein MauD